MFYFDVYFICSCWFFLVVLLGFNDDDEECYLHFEFSSLCNENTYTHKDLYKDLYKENEWIRGKFLITYYGDCWLLSGFDSFYINEKEIKKNVVFTQEF